MAAKQKAPDERAKVIDNRKARHSFEVLETFEAGIALRGTEVKTLREGKAHLEEAYARIDGGEVFLVGAHIAEYSHGNVMNHEPTRRRKLLLRKAQIRKLEASVKQKGLTLVPLKIYFNDRGLVKVQIGLCRGRKTVDKRDKERKREATREIRDHG
jgi:SsrA-binding protein